MADTKKFLTFDVFQKNEEWIRDFINEKDSLSIKTVSLSSDNTRLEFYKVDSPTSSTPPAISIEIPVTSLDSVIKKVMGATAGDVPILTADGSLSDSGIKAADLATTTAVAQMIAEKISQASHMKKELVTTLPSPDKADANTFYLVKKDSVTGADKYEIWTLIGSDLVMIDDTSIDLSGYIDTATLTAALAKIKSEALAEAAADAQKKADAALNSAKAYTDAEVAKVSTRVGTLETTVSQHTNSISVINNTLSTHGDRITALEEKEPDVATEAEALAAFNAIFYPKS